MQLLARPTSQHFVNPTTPHLHHQQQDLETLKCEMDPSLDAGRVCSSDDETMGRCAFGQRDGCFADWGSERSFYEMPDNLWSGVSRVMMGKGMA